MGKPALETLTTRNAIYKGQVKKVARKYRDKLRINTEAVIDTYKKEERALLGRYRHGGNFTNYDQLVEQINEKYQDVNLGFSNEVIHSLSSRVNDLILECLLEAVKQQCSKH